MDLNSSELDDLIELLERPIFLDEDEDDSVHARLDPIRVALLLRVRSARWAKANFSRSELRRIREAEEAGRVSISTYPPRMTGSYTGKETRIKPISAAEKLGVKKVDGAGLLALLNLTPKAES